MNDLHPQIELMKQSRLSELQTEIDKAQAEINTIRRELVI